MNFDVYASFTLGLLCTIIPLFYGFRAFRSKAFNSAFDDLITTFLNINTTPESLATIRSAPDQSSVLFQKWFQEIMCYIRKKEERKLILVFDNLDRLEVEEQIEAWRTLQIFLEARQKKELAQNLTFIICYDLSNHTDERAYDDMAERFEKLLDTKFLVPQMPVQKWSTYAQSAFDKRNFSTDQIEDALETLKIIYGKDNTITPRRLDQCANDVRALLLQNEKLKIDSNEKATIKLLVCYWHELNQSEFRKRLFIERLLSSEIDKRTSIALNKPLNEISISFAQLYFGLEKKEAVHALLSRPIKQALQEGKHAQLLNFPENVNGYETVLKSELRDILVSHISMQALHKIIQAMFGSGQKIPAHENCIGIFEQNLPTEKTEIFLDEKDAIPMPIAV